MSERWEILGCSGTCARWFRSRGWRRNVRSGWFRFGLGLVGWWWSCCGGVCGDTSFISFMGFIARSGLFWLILITLILLNCFSTASHCHAAFFHPISHGYLPTKSIYFSESYLLIHFWNCSISTFLADHFYYCSDRFSLPVTFTGCLLLYLSSSVVQWICTSLLLEGITPTLSDLKAWILLASFAYQIFSACKISSSMIVSSSYRRLMMIYPLILNVLSGILATDQTVF